MAGLIKSLMGVGIGLVHLGSDAGSQKYPLLMTSWKIQPSPVACVVQGTGCFKRCAASATAVLKITVRVSCGRNMETWPERKVYCIITSTYKIFPY